MAGRNGRVQNFVLNESFLVTGGIRIDLNGAGADVYFLLKLGFVKELERCVIDAGF
jgi:hypothetical protein